MSDSKVTGACLCGEVSYQITDNSGKFLYCHCSRCRKATGSAFAANIIVAPKHFEWTRGEEMVGVYNLPEAQHFANAFCKKCGSTLPWKVQTGQAVVIPAGTLMQEPTLRPQGNIFCASRAEWYVEPNAIPEHNQMPTTS